MENLKKNEKKLLGAFVDGRFVIKFTVYVKRNNWKLNALYKSIAEFWLSLDPVIQGHIYHGRFDNAISGLSQTKSAIEDESEAAGDSKETKHKSDRQHSSKSG